MKMAPLGLLYSTQIEPLYDSMAFLAIYKPISVFPDLLYLNPSSKVLSCISEGILIELGRFYLGNFLVFRVCNSIESGMSQFFPVKLGRFINSHLKRIR